jgi:hypothetical protein
VGDVAAGAAHEVVEHPLKTAAEVAGGLVLATAAAELGVGALAGAAVGGVALAGYGVVRGIQIASKEGIGAIPAHMKGAYEDAKHSAGDMLSAASTIYHGETGQKAEQAAAKLESLGRGAVPIAAFAVGGGAGEYGQMALRGGAQMLEDILPALSLEPAYALAGGGIVGGAIATTPGRFGAEQVAAAAEAGAVMQMSEAGPGRGGNMSDYDRQQHFIEGKKGPVLPEAPTGPAAQIGEGFKNIDNVLKNGGKSGYLEFADDGNGWYSVKVTEGPWAGRTGIWEKGAAKFHLDGGNGQSFDVDLH